MASKKGKNSEMPDGFIPLVSERAPWVAAMAGNVVYGEFRGIYRVNSSSRMGDPRYIQVCIEQPCTVAGPGDGETVQAEPGTTVNLGVTHALREVAEKLEGSAPKSGKLWVSFDRKIQTSSGNSFWEVRAAWKASE